MRAPCSCGVSLLNEPVRRSGYQIPHGHAGLRAARRGRRSNQSSRSVSKPEAYVRPNIVSSGFWESPAKGSAFSTSRSAETKKIGSSLIATAVAPPTPRAGDQRVKLVRRCPAAERSPEVDALLGVEAQVEYAVGGESAPVTAGAERLGRGCDDPEHRAVGERVPVGGRGALFPHPPRPGPTPPPEPSPLRPG